MRPARCSGVLCHITSLPSRYGVGDLGPNAYRFADFLRMAGQGRWQILPLNPTSSVMGNSPYSSDSAQAGDTLLISPQRLVDEHNLTREDLADSPVFPTHRVDYAAVRAHRARVLDAAWGRWRDDSYGEDFERFCWENRLWLDDYALFRAIKDQQGGKAWCDWPRELRDRKSAALVRASRLLAEPVRRVKVFQYIFERQWQALRRYCNDHLIQIIGDAPYYVAYDSADVWSRQELWKLDRHRRPTFVAGTPPDAFSDQGQLWGMPVYDWEANRRADYDWWVNRIERNLRLYDLVRIDHFRGFLGTWQVPAGAKAAKEGHWEEHPQDALMDRLLRRRPYLQIIAEDLGLITPDVREFMHKYDLPGMRLVQVCFGARSVADDEHAPHNYPRNCVVYTGTHDNNTAKGWFETEADARAKRQLFAYLGRRCSGRRVNWDLIRLAMMSAADTAIIPMQDILGLGAEARMNRPGVLYGAWEWRFGWGEVSRRIGERLGEMSRVFGRTTSNGRDG